MPFPKCITSILALVALGTPCATQIPKPILLKDINSSPGQSSYPHDFINVHGIAYFVANDGTGDALWKTDGTVTGSARILPATSLKPLLDHSSVRLGNKLIFNGDDGKSGVEAWVTDGTVKGTAMLADAVPGSGSGGLYGPIVMGGTCYYWIDNGPGYDLFKTDGTSAGTLKIGSPAGLSRCWKNPVALGDKILFQGSFTGSGNELGISDGTLAGTKMVKDIYPGSNSGIISSISPTPLLRFQNKVYFHAYNGSNNAIWQTDGTPGGTRAFYYSRAVPWIVSGGRLYFRAPYDIGRGPGFWVTDGTASGTVKLGTNNCMSALPHNGKIFFADSKKCSIYTSDGTLAGTKMVFDPPGTTMEVLSFVPTGGSKYLFLRVKTMNNTFPPSYKEEAFIYDFLAGKGEKYSGGPSRTSHLCHAGNTVVLQAVADSNTGSELCTLDPGATVESRGVGHDLELYASFPVMGQSMTIAVANPLSSSTRILLFADPATNPVVLGNSGLFFNLNLIYTTICVPTAGVSLPIPLMPPVIGDQVAAQAFSMPGAGFMGVDFTQGLVLTLDVK